MGTYLELQQKVARKLTDPDNGTFSVDMVKDFISSAWAEIDGIAPRHFQEDVTPLVDTLSYQLLVDDFADPNEYIDPVRVEVWDGTVTPAVALRRVSWAGADPGGTQYSQVGWSMWGGLLYLPNSIVDFIDPDFYFLRVWGYSPWPFPTTDEDDISFGNIHEEALVIKCQIEAYRSLQANRAQFTQWQTRSNNTDLTIGGLMNLKEGASAEWRALGRRIQVLRERPG